jgi:hypothetical protein
MIWCSLRVGVKALGISLIMFTKMELEPLSIRARVALAITCLERFVDMLDARTSRLQSLIDHLWSYTNLEELAIWDEKQWQFRPESDDPNLQAAWFGFEHFEPGRYEQICLLIENVFEVATGNLYGGYDSELTMYPLINSLSILITLGKPPELDAFLRHRMTTRTFELFSRGKKELKTVLDAWGEPQPASFFRN